MRRWYCKTPWAGVLLGMVLSGGLVNPAWGGEVSPALHVDAGVFVRREVSGEHGAVLKFDRPKLRAAARRAGDAPMSLLFPLEGGVALELQRFYVTGADTRFVIGQLGGADLPLSGFNPADVILLRGTDRGADGFERHAFLAFDDRRALGSVTLGDTRYALTAQAHGLAADELLVTRAGANGFALPPDVPMCGLQTPVAAAPIRVRAAVEPARKRQRLQLAVETDYEFYERFGDADDAAFYVTALYGAVSDIYMRDVNTRIELSFVRIWDNPADMFNDPDPLVPFANWWESNMLVERDAAQFLTGRRDLPYGGVAWLSGLCGSFGYSVAGLINGFFDPSGEAGSSQWDIIVTAHELGHTCGTVHTHDFGLDDCYPHPGTEERGTIMGYCHTQNGGVANTDVRFHREVQDTVAPFVATSACIDDDCNANGIDDATDIAAGTSADGNGNGAPDECEDCDGDGERDDLEIAGGAADADNDGVPDICQPDCNTNALPDRYEIEQGISPDANGNSIPDGCEPDCDTDGVPDFAQIRADMDLDINRNNRLDACEDCDGDGTSDVQALAGAHAAWVVGDGSGTAYAYHGVTGARAVMTTGGTVSEAQDVIIGANGNVLVASGSNWRVIEFDRQTGAFIRNFVGTGSGGMRYPAGLAYGWDGNLYVSSRDTDAIFKYDGATGAFIAQFVLPGFGGLDAPYGLTFGPNGNLFVCSGGTNEVLEYDGATGTFVRVFVSAGSGGLFAPRGLTFKHDGNLLVASSANGRVLEYDRQSGAYLGIFNRAFATVGFNLGAWGVAIGPNGNVFVTRHVSEYRVFELEASTGTYLRSFVRGPYAGLDLPTAIAFAPGFSADCNVNFIPDACEVAAGSALDGNTNGVPDACETDCDGNGTADWLEIVPRGKRLDCNFNGMLDDCELASGGAGPDVCIACSTPGDFDSDGDYDLLDGYYFTRCFGADVTVDPECACANVDASDNVVDADDWALLEASLTGPS